MHNQPYFVRFAVNERFDNAWREAERERLLRTVKVDVEGRGRQLLARWSPPKLWASVKADFGEAWSRLTRSSEPQEQCC